MTKPQLTILSSLITLNLLLTVADLSLTPPMSKPHEIKASVIIVDNHEFLVWESYGGYSSITHRPNCLTCKELPWTNLIFNPKYTNLLSFPNGTTNAQ